MKYQSTLFDFAPVGDETSTDAWCTPAWIVDLVREFYGEIDLDPCSNGRSVVGAKTSYTLTDDGLAQPWEGKVYCNPPYSDCEPWLRRCSGMPELGGEAIALPKGDWSTRWWRLYVRTAAARCLLDRRVKFVHADGGTTATFPSALVYWGTRVGMFRAVFGPHGEVI